ncbi:hypothetical protein [Streptosporangium oxazolinicum]
MKYFGNGGYATVITQLSQDAQATQIHHEALAYAFHVSILN